MAERDELAKYAAKPDDELAKYAANPASPTSQRDLNTLNVPGGEGFPGIPNPIPNIIPENEAYKSIRTSGGFSPTGADPQTHTAQSAERALKEYNPGGQLVQAAMAPSLVKGAITAPLRTGAALGGSYAGGKAARGAASLFGAGETGQDIAEIGGGLAGGLVGGFAPEIGGGIRSFGRKLLLDPVTGRATLTPGTLAERIFRTPEEAQAIRDSKELGGIRRRDALSKAKAEPDATEKNKPFAGEENMFAAPKERDATKLNVPFAGEEEPEPPAPTIRSVGAGEKPSEGRPATWENETVRKLAGLGDPDAMAQQRARMLGGEGRVPMKFSEAQITPRSVTRFTPEGQPIEEGGGIRDAFEEAQPAEIKGVTEPVKPKAAPREKPIPVERKYSPEEITDAEGLIQQEIGMMQSADRPGSYFDEWEQGNAPIKQNLSVKQGERAGGKWRGVKSGRSMQPFMSANPDLNPAALEKALRNKDSAMYLKAMDRAVDFIRRRGGSLAGDAAEPEAIAPGGEDFRFGANEEQPSIRSAYRVQDVGQTEIDPASHAHATASPEEAQSYLEGRQSIRGVPQEIRKINLEGFAPEHLTAMPGPSGNTWYKFGRPLKPEDYLE